VASGCLRLWFYGDGWADPLGELALIGRAAETEIIDQLLGDAFSGRSGVLVLTGEAGVGKSVLLAYARARADGMDVLQTAGVQSEAEIEFAALYQLLRPALDGVGSLPPPQSAALGAALGVEPGRPANRFLIGAAVLSGLARKFVGGLCGQAARVWGLGLSRTSIRRSRSPRSARVNLQVNGRAMAL
jgi:hypothetical protein